MIKKLTIVALSLTLMTSCTIRRTITFNKDYSGHFEYVIDYEEMAKLTQSMDTAKTFEAKSFLEGSNLESLSLLFQKEGISNIQIMEDTGKNITIQFDFADLNALNNVMSSPGLTTNMNVSDDDDKKGKKKVITRKGKNIVFHEPKKKKSETKLDSKGESGGTELLKFGTLETCLVFADEIKSINRKDAIISADKKTACLKLDLQEMAEGKANTSMKIKLK